MKNFPLIIAVFLGVVVVIVASVFVYESMISAPKAAEEKSILKQYAVPAYEDTNKNVPSSGFGAPVSVGKDDDIQSLMNDVSEASDEAGTTDIQNLKTEVSGL